jgi:Phosphoinositide phospholipase C, Ca2+-dependent
MGFSSSPSAEAFYPALQILVTSPIYHATLMRMCCLVSIVAACLAAALPQRNLDAGAARACSPITVENSDDCVRLNQIQLLGTHNSYHVAPPPPLLATLGARARNIDYTHRPLATQLSELGIRKFELDVFADPEGGRFATPAALRLVKGLEAVGAELRDPGFKVLHTPDIDYRTTCTTLKACLLTIRDWSRSNSWHAPIMVMLEAKDEPLEDPDGVGYVKPLRVGVAEFRALDAEIRSVFDDRHVLTPDRVRGKHPTLRDAVQTDGWPALRAARGKILFALDNTDAHRDDYLRGNPSLEGRMLFVSSAPPQSSAAFIKMNEALDGEEQRIREQVGAGFLVRTRADIPTVEARNGSTVRRDAAFRSGAQYVSTDYPEPSPFGSGYVARLPGAAGLAARCNPVNAPPGCRDEWLERPARQRPRR